MKRIYKFRAWDKTDKRMIVDEQDFIPLLVTNKGVFRLNPHYEFDLYNPMDNDRFELMQFTGLKDKNGVEIYEGDICTFTNPYNKQEYKRIVRYCTLLACFGLYTDMETVYDYESDWLKIINIQVIGDIYSNPELL